MLLIGRCIYMMLLSSMVASLQLNLHLTDKISDATNVTTVPHDCFHVRAQMKTVNDHYQVISYCMSERPAEGQEQQSGIHKNFTFSDLFKRNITSEELYLWSAPIDVAEQYQFYLDLKLTSREKVLAIEKELFYNCTLQRFGPFCQYSLMYDSSIYSSLAELVQQFYMENDYEPSTLTCYLHFRCDLGSDTICLAWSDICDGAVQCQDGADEELCWSLEINACEDDEYRCHNGQCIPMIFFNDADEVMSEAFECLDRSDEKEGSISTFAKEKAVPTFANEDIACLKWFSLMHWIKLTSSCVKQRLKLLMEGMLSARSQSMDDDSCWLALQCQFTRSFRDRECRSLVRNNTLGNIIQAACSEYFNMPPMPVAFGHMYVAYKRDHNPDRLRESEPYYICYDERRCGSLLPNSTLTIFPNMICRRPTEFPLYDRFDSEQSWWIKYIRPLYIDQSQCNTILYKDSTRCDHPRMYRCMHSSKCISKYRLCDLVKDCDYGDDERCSLKDEICSIHGVDVLFYCTETSVCISPKLVGDGWCNCGTDFSGLCDDEVTGFEHVRNHISFPTICDGFTELAPILIDGHNQTDETECDYWHCNNTYTRCDGLWNCLNGADEIGCELSPLLECGADHHICASFETRQLICLPIVNASDGTIDCLGATDEPSLCRNSNYGYIEQFNSCMTISSHYFIQLCSLSLGRLTQNETRLCEIHSTLGFTRFCDDIYASIRSDVGNYFCGPQFTTKKSDIIHFSLGRKINLDQEAITHRAQISTSSSSIIEKSCHRGFPLRVWMNTEQNKDAITCLCPPSFYGSHCQFENERVSLTMRFQTFSDSRQILFVLVISLIDDSFERAIHSQEQLTYLSVRDCQRKFNLYLLYSNRPKDQSKHYVVHVDIYEKISLEYRGSMLIPLPFPFLPVQRVAVQLQLPSMDDTVLGCSDPQCIHGRCIRYWNNVRGTTFCQCQQGWSGIYCTISHMCMCSPHSLCVGILPNNQSLCVCPVDRFGRRCLLRNTICHADSNDTCFNGAQCIPSDGDEISGKKFTCICRKGFTGERCELTDERISLSFHRDINLSQSILLHFIRTFDHASPENGSAYKLIPASQRVVTVYWSHPFHVALAELVHNRYYVVAIHAQNSSSTPIARVIAPSDRCPYISELLNDTVAQLHLLRRIKLYHLTCQNYSSSFSCFYDDNHLCLCTKFGAQRVANCFEFDYRRKFDCFGHSQCENSARCLQDSLVCPKTSICACQTCFYGTRCQFSSTSSGLSLDAILGYHIQPNTNVRRQPSIVQVSIVLTATITVVSLVNGILCLVTFKNKKPRETGCGYYLLGSSMTTLLTTLVFLAKFLILITAQMTPIRNRLFLQIQCLTVDFLLQVNLSMDQWLGACVAMDRAITASKGASINKKKSIKLAKYLIIFLLLLIISTNIHDPIHRKLIDENDDDGSTRLWCIVRYSSNMHVFNSIMHTFHFLAPFAINLISTVIILSITTRKRISVRKNQEFRELLREQFRKYGHLLISPLILVILAMPRLIISVTSGCMNSADDSWLYLLGYYVSYFPPMLSFVVFVLPSHFYKEEFQKSIKQYRRTIGAKWQKTIH